MTKITWNTDVNAPCCPGEILGDNGESSLVQTDYDYPGVASTFGWNIVDVQPDDDDDRVLCRDSQCDHSGTDGTVDCNDCGMTASEFISAAGEFLADNDGATVDDPGYFS